MKYPGGKNSAGTYQRIINQIPPHRVYIEPFAGSAAVLRYKRPAERNIVLDRDPAALDQLRDRVPPNTVLLEENALRWLEDFEARGSGFGTGDSGPDVFIYCDPPYLPEVCRSRLRYKHNLTAEDHERLLTILLKLPCPVMISGYESELYKRLLADWRSDCFQQITRGGFQAEEWLWMNYPEPTALHDYRYLGADYREREKFARRRRRWTARLEKMAPIERQALMAALEEVG